MRNILLLTFLVAINSLNSINAQSCYIQLDDLSGTNISIDVSLLEEVSCNLKDAMNQDSFAVYDYSSYIAEEAIGSEMILNNRERAISKINSSFYLLFERRSNSYQLNYYTYIHLKLPSSGFFQYFTESDYLVIKVQLQELANGSKDNFLNQKMTIEKFETIINEMKECPQQDSCNLCPELSEQNDFLKSFKFNEAKFESSSQLKKSKIISRTSTITDYAQLSLTVNGYNLNLKNDFEDILEEFEYKGWITDGNDICTERFDEAAIGFEDNVNSVWFHIDTANKLLFFKYQGNDISGSLSFLECFFNIDQDKYKSFAKLDIKTNDKEIHLNSSGLIEKITDNKNLLLKKDGANFLLNDPIFDSQNLDEYIKIRKDASFKDSMPPLLRQITQSKLIGWLAPIPSNPIFPIKYLFPFKESNATKKPNAKMDFTITYIDSEIQPSPLPWDLHWFYHLEGYSAVAYNSHDFGNYVWGAAMKKLGFTVIEARCYADKNSIITGDGPDSEGDQRAISHGYEYVPQN